MISNRAQYKDNSSADDNDIFGSVYDLEFQSFLVAIKNESYSHISNELKNDPLILAHVTDPIEIKFVDKVHKFNEFKIK